jgi:hypothetical protein
MKGWDSKNTTAPRLGWAHRRCEWMDEVSKQLIRGHAAWAEKVEEGGDVC